MRSSILAAAVLLAVPAFAAPQLGALPLPSGFATSTSSSAEGAPTVLAPVLSVVSEVVTAIIPAPTTSTPAQMYRRWVMDM
jgi:hypothetical protein